MINDADYAVRFGETVDKGMDGGPVAFPFIYSFVDRESDTYDPTSANPLNGIGPLVAAGGVVEHPVRLDADYMYRALWYKYSAYWLSEGTVYWYEPLVAMGNGLLEYDYQAQIGTPLTDSIRISVSFHGPDARYLYGGKNLDNMINLQGDLLGLSPQILQGYEYGFAQLRTPHLLPREGIILFRIENRHAVKNLYVTGLVYGLKVRL